MMMVIVKESNIVRTSVEWFSYIVYKIDCSAYFIGDGICDDENNNDVCEYDALDCCENEPGHEYQFAFCDQCECIF